MLNVFKSYDETEGFELDGVKFGLNCEVVVFSRDSGEDFLGAICEISEHKVRM
jgi:hypothetical protein